MSPEERQLLQGLFDRMRNNASAPRDGEADRLISDNVRQQPYSPYYLTQTVLVQEHALEAASQRIQQLEQQVEQGGSSQGSGGGFLSSIFGGGSTPKPPATVPPARPVWNQGGAAPGGGYPQGAPGYQGGGYQGGGYQGSYAPPPPQGGPWSGGGGGGGGFLHGALQTAAGVAGGALLFDGIRGLMGGHGSPFGIGAGTPGAGESVVNNYYGDSAGGSQADWQQDADQDQDMAQDAGGYGSGPTEADWQQDADQDQDFSQDNDGSLDV